MHGIETVIYLRELIPMRDILVDLHVSFQIICSKEERVRPSYGEGIRL